MSQFGARLPQPIRAPSAAPLLPLETAPTRAAQLQQLFREVTQTARVGIAAQQVATQAEIGQIRRDQQKAEADIAGQIAVQRADVAKIRAQREQIELRSAEARIEHKKLVDLQDRQLAAALSQMDPEQQALFLGRVPYIQHIDQFAKSVGANLAASKDAAIKQRLRETIQEGGSPDDLAAEMSQIILSEYADLRGKVPPEILGRAQSLSLRKGGEQVSAFFQTQAKENQDMAERGFRQQMNFDIRTMLSGRTDEDPKDIIGTLLDHSQVDSRIRGKSDRFLDELAVQISSQVEDLKDTVAPDQLILNLSQMVSGQPKLKKRLSGTIATLERELSDLNNREGNQFNEDVLRRIKGLSKNLRRDELLMEFSSLLDSPLSKIAPNRNDTISQAQLVVDEFNQKWGAAFSLVDVINGGPENEGTRRAKLVGDNWDAVWDIEVERRRRDPLLTLEKILLAGDIIPKQVIGQIEQDMNPETQNWERALLFLRQIKEVRPALMDATVQALDNGSEASMLLTVMEGISPEDDRGRDLMFRMRDRTFLLAGSDARIAFDGGELSTEKTVKSVNVARELRRGLRIDDVPSGLLLRTKPAFKDHFIFHYRDAMNPTRGVPDSHNARVKYANQRASAAIARQFGVFEGPIIGFSPLGDPTTIGRMVVPAEIGLGTVAAPNRTAQREFSETLGEWRNDMARGRIIPPAFVVHPHLAVREGTRAYIPRYTKDGELQELMEWDIFNQTATRRFTKDNEEQQGAAAGTFDRIGKLIERKVSPAGTDMFANFRNVPGVHETQIPDRVTVNDETGRTMADVLWDLSETEWARVTGDMPNLKSRADGGEWEDFEQFLIKLSRDLGWQPFDVRAAPTPEEVEQEEATTAFIGPQPAATP